MEKKFESFELRENFNSICTALYSYSTSLKMYYSISFNEQVIDIAKNGINECLARIRISKKECLNLAKEIKSICLPQSVKINIKTLGYAETSLDTLGRVINDVEIKNEIGEIAEELRNIIDNLS